MNTKKAKLINRERIEILNNIYNLQDIQNLLYVSYPIYF